MSDVVERLRAAAPIAANGHILREAADEIERLRRPPDVAVLRETDELVEKVGAAIIECHKAYTGYTASESYANEVARAAIRAMLSSAPSAADRAYTEGSEGRSVK